MNIKAKWPWMTVVICLVATAWAGENGMIFYAPFEESTMPVVGKAAITEQKLEFVEGKKGKAVKLGTGAQLVYPTEGNFNKTQGTVEFWLYWPKDRANINGNLFAIGALDKANSFLGWNDGNIVLRIYNKEAKNHYAYIPVSNWMPGEWHHLAYTWEKINSAENATWALFVDGAGWDSRKEKIEINDISSEMVIGREGMVLDELKIYDYAKGGQQLWSEVRPQLVKKVFKETGADKVVSKKEVINPMIDMGSYITGGTINQTVCYKGYNILNVGYIGVRDPSGKNFSSNLFRRKVELIEYEDGHCELNWKDKIEEIGFEHKSKLVLLKDRVKYSIEYTFSREISHPVMMSSCIGPILGASYKATDIDGKVSEGKFPDALPAKTSFIPLKPLGKIELNTDKAGKLIYVIKVDDYWMGQSNRIALNPNGVRIDFGQNSGNSAGYSNFAELEVIFE